MGWGASSSVQRSQPGPRLLSDQQSHLVSIDWLREKQLASLGQEGGGEGPCGEAGAVEPEGLATGLMRLCDPRSPADLPGGLQGIPVHGAVPALV